MRQCCSNSELGGGRSWPFLGAPPLPTWGQSSHLGRSPPERDAPPPTYPRLALDEPNGRICAGADVGKRPGIRRDVAQCSFPEAPSRACGEAHQIWTDHGQLGADLDRHWPTLARLRPNLRRCGSTPTSLGPTSNKARPISTKFDQVRTHFWAEFGRIDTERDQHRTDFDQGCIECCQIQSVST